MLMGDCGASGGMSVGRGSVGSTGSGGTSMMDYPKGSGAGASGTGSAWGSQTSSRAISTKRRSGLSATWNTNICRTGNMRVRGIPSAKHWKLWNAVRNRTPWIIHRSSRWTPRPKAPSSSSLSLTIPPMCSKRTARGFPAKQATLCPTENGTPTAITPNSATRSIKPLQHDCSFGELITTAHSQEWACSFISNHIHPRPPPHTDALPGWRR
jgi:hypothetical protein